MRQGVGSLAASGGAAETAVGVEIGLSPAVTQNPSITRICDASHIPESPGLGSGAQGPFRACFDLLGGVKAR